MSSPNPTSKTREERVEKSIATLNRTLESIEKEANKYNSSAERQRRFYKVSRALIAGLGVITPVVITYQTQNPTDLLRIIAILLTALTGIITTVHAIFRWGEGYVRAKLTSLTLKELFDRTDLRRYEIEDNYDDMSAYSLAIATNREVRVEMQRILRNQIESEIAVVTQDKEKPTPELPPAPSTPRLEAGRP
jgi:Protein of unknown function (DUF4231)